LNSVSPPRLAQKMLLWFLREALVEEVLGDLEEKFYRDVKTRSVTLANINYWLQVLNYLRPFAIKKIGDEPILHYAMLHSNLKVGWRNLLKNKGYSFINIGGLAVGMAVAMLIGLWIQYEISYDRFHNNRDRIALVMKHTLFNGERNTQEAVPLPLYDELKTNYPEIKRVSRYSWEFNQSLVVGTTRLNKMGHFVDPPFLEMFSFPFLKGDVKTALNDPNSIILAQSLATLLFGEGDPLGKTIRMENQYDVQVTGVIADPPTNSSIQFDFLAPYEFQIATSSFLQNNRTNWGNNMLMNVVEITEGASMEALSAKIGPLNVQKSDRVKNQTFFLHPMSQWHLFNEFKDWVNVGGRIQYVRLFGVIGIFVLLIACINFMNLSTARSEKRAREVGIRKAIGSRRKQLIAQFMSESMLTAFLAFMLAIGLVYVSLPSLATLGFGDIALDLTDPWLVSAAFGICIFAGFTAGSYPALYLSSLVPVSVLKGVFRQGKGPAVFRSVLVVSQFSISIVLIISTMIVFQQVDHAKHRSLGYNPDNLISIEGSGDLAKHYAVLKQELLRSGYVASVARASSPMTEIYNRWSDFSWDGKDPDEDIALDAVMTEWDFEKTAGLKIKQGRAFSIDHAADSNAVILNEAAVKVIGYENPVGRTMKTGDREVTIIGVVEDVLMKNPYEPVDPAVILFNAEAANSILIRLKETSDLNKALASMQPIFEKYNPSLPFEYSFVNDDFNRKFRRENAVGKLAAVFAVLAIFISCLGLFGLASFVAEQRTKEIGIRKVLGASVFVLWRMLSRHFVLLVIISGLIAIPIAYFLMDHWLQRYEYRTEINVWVFALTIFGALSITLLTVSFQAIKAAMMNPVTSLKTE